MTLILVFSMACQSSKPGKHHSHKKAKRQASGYFFHFQH